jgi:hypothetical protein
VKIVQCCAGFEGVPSKAEIVHGWGAQPRKTELLQRYAGLGSMASKAEIMQGCRVWPSETELLKGCTGLVGHGLGADRKYLWIPVLKGSTHGNPASLRGGSLG